MDWAPVCNFFLTNNNKNDYLNFGFGGALHLAKHMGAEKLSYTNQAISLRDVLMN